MLNKKDLIENFLNGYIKGKGSNLEIEKTTLNGADVTALWNYSTIIAYRFYNGDIVLNSRKYSQTTSVNQNIIRRNTNADELFELDASEFYEGASELVERNRQGKRQSPAEFDRVRNTKRKLKSLYSA